MNSTNTNPRFFAVTTLGLTATRWLSHVLASHPDTYVAHGKFALDSVVRGNFLHEKDTAHVASMSQGNEMREFYETRSLEEVLAVYQGIKPGAHAYGCVHSYTIHTLAQAARLPATLANLRVLNVVRHPVALINSHYGLVRDSEKHPALYQFYLEEVFPQALQQFPELFLMGCPDYRAFLAFAISCRAVNNQILDMCYPGLRTLKMETLTTEPQPLREFCEELTGLTYSSESLAEFIRQGAINQHQAAKTRRNPTEVYAQWAPWQKDMANIMISGLVLDWLEGIGYDLSMLREKAVPACASDPAKAKVPCLADLLRSMDQRHPLLAYTTTKGFTRVQVIETEYQGFHLVPTQDKVCAVANAVNMEEFSKAGVETLSDLAEDGMIVRGNTVPEVWHGIAHAISSEAKLIEEYLGYNILTYRGNFYAAPLGAVMDLERLKTPARKKLLKAKKLFAGESAAAIKRQIDLAPREKSGAPLGNRKPDGFPRHADVHLVEEGYANFNLVAYEGRYFALAQRIGQVHLPGLSEAELQKLQQRGDCLIAVTLRELKQMANAAPAKQRSKLPAKMRVLLSSLRSLLLSGARK